MVTYVDNKSRKRTRPVSKPHRFSLTGPLYVADLKQIAPWALNLFDIQHH
jgi:hypothetical protein